MLDIFYPPLPLKSMLTISKIEGDVTWKCREAVVAENNIFNCNFNIDFGGGVKICPNI